MINLPNLQDTNKQTNNQNFTSKHPTYNAPEQIKIQRTQEKYTRQTKNNLHINDMATTEYNKRIPRMRDPNGALAYMKNRS